MNLCWLKQHANYVTFACGVAFRVKYRCNVHLWLLAIGLNALVSKTEILFFPVWRAVGNILIFFSVDGGDGVLLLLLPSRWWLLLLIRCVNDLLAVTQVVLYKRCVSSTVPMCSSYPYYPSSLHVIAINVVPIVFVLVFVCTTRPPECYCLSLCQQRWRNTTNRRRRWLLVWSFSLLYAVAA